MHKSMLSLLAALALLSLGACADRSNAPSQAEMLAAAGRILLECDQEILGRKHQEGERITLEQSAAITECMDKKGAAYKEKVESGKK